MRSDRNRFMLNDNSYILVKHLVQVVLPACASLYFGLSSIWSFPAVEEVVGTLAVVATFLGVTLGISSREYKESGSAYDGSMVVSQSTEGMKKFLLELDTDPDDLENKKSITFKIRPTIEPNYDNLM